MNPFGSSLWAQEEGISIILIPSFEIVLPMQVKAFTAAQIPYIENRIYPSEVAGPNYPGGSPFIPRMSFLD